MNPTQLSLVSILEETKQADQPYFNAAGEPLPWEQELVEQERLCELLGHTSEIFIQKEDYEAVR